MTDTSINRTKILVATVLVNLCVGAVYAFSVLAGPLAQKYGWTRPEIMMAFTINNAISPIPMILGGRLLDKGLARAAIMTGGAMFGLGFILAGMSDTLTGLYLSYGVLAGLGQGIAYSGTIGNTVRLFPDRRGFASGVVTAGFGGATIIAAPMAHMLIERSGISATFQILGAAYLILTVCAGFFVKATPVGYKPAGWTPPAVASAGNAAVNMNWREMLGTRKFYIIASMFMIGALSGMMIAANASAIGQKMFGLTAAVAALYVSLYSLSNCLGRIFWGTVSDKLGRYKTLICVYSVIALMLLVMANSSTSTGFAISIIGIGLCFGGTLGIFPSIVGENFGMRFYGVNYGITFIGYSLAAFFGPRIAAEVASANNGNYTQAFYIALICSLVGIGLALLFMALEKRERQGSTSLAHTSVATQER